METFNFYCSQQVTSKLTALKGLDARLREIRGYLDLVVDGKLPLNHEILYHLQVAFILIFFFDLCLFCKRYVLKRFCVTVTEKTLIKDYKKYPYYKS